MKKFIIRLPGILFCAITILSAQQHNGFTFSNPPRVEIPNSQVLKLRSSIVEQEYDLYIHLPRTYNDTTKNFPVLYLLDAQWDFTLMTALYGQQYYDGFVPEIIIVGITWGGNNPNPDSLRIRDFTPSTVRGVVQSGGAKQFQSFLKTELIPFIDIQFRTVKDDRALVGSSLGGLFTVYSLFTEPAIFKRYIATSPAIGWDEEIVFSFEKSYFKKKSKTPTRLYIAEGGLETGLTEFKKFVISLQTQKINGLTIENKILENTGHSGGKAEGYSRGLQFAYKKNKIILPPKIFRQYCGRYQIQDNIIVDIVEEKNHLIVKFPDGLQFTLNAETQYNLYVHGQFMRIQMVKNKDNNHFDGFILERFNSAVFCKKL